LKVLELDTNKPNLKFIKNRKIIRNFFGPKTLTQLTPETEIPSILNLNTSAEKVNYFLKVNERHFIPKNTTYQSTGQLRGAFTQSTQYEQIYRGLPVFGAKIVISQRKTDHVITSAINSFDLDLPVAMETEEGRITAQQVIEIAHKLFDAKFGVIKLGVPKLYIYRHLPARMVKPLTPSETLKKITEQSTGQTNSIYVAWRLAMDTQEPHSNWELLINAVNGNLITARDRASYNTRKGKVFWPDPIRRKKDSTLYWPNNSAKDKVMRKTLVEQTVEKEIGNLNPPNSNKQYSLTG